MSAHNNSVYTYYEESSKLIATRIIIIFCFLHITKGINQANELVELYENINHETLKQSRSNLKFLRFKESDSQLHIFSR